MGRTLVVKELDSGRLARFDAAYPTAVSETSPVGPPPARSADGRRFPLPKPTAQYPSSELAGIRPRTQHLNRCQRPRIVRALATKDTA